MLTLLLIAALARPASAAEGCGGRHTETSKRYLGFADDAASTVDALRIALADARRAALADLCVGDLADPAGCEELGQHVYDGSGFPDATRVRGRWSTCAWVEVRQEGFRQLTQTREQVRAGFARAARAVREAIAPPGQPVPVGAGLFLSAPTWPGGCDAGLSGASVQAELRQALLADGAVLQSRRSDAAHAVQVVLEPGAKGTLSAVVRVVGRDLDRVVGSVAFPPGFFPVDAPAAARCRVWADLGLGERAHAGTAGLSVALSIDAPDHDVCAGETFRVEAAVRGAAPADPPELVLLSVEADGDAFVVARAPGTTLVTSAGAFPSEPEAQEAFVLVAVPAGAAFQPGWTRDCLLPAGTFHADRLPPEASWAQLPYTTRDTGTGRCVSTDPAIATTRQRIQEIVAAAKVCGR